MGERLAGLALLLSPLAVLLPPSAQAEVVEASDHGFQLAFRVPIAAPPQRVWDILVQPSQWWQASHSYSGDAANLTLDLRPGGCWCERLPHNGGVEHMRVVFVRSGEELRLSGGLGPLQALGVSAALGFAIASDGGGTILTARYAVGGFAPGGLAGFAAPVDAVLQAQLHSLARAAAGQRRGQSE